MPTGAMAAMAAAAQLLRGLAESVDVPFMLSASSVDESASEQGDSSADEPRLCCRVRRKSRQSKVTVQTPTVLALALNVIM